MFQCERWPRASAWKIQDSCGDLEDACAGCVDPSREGDSPRLADRVCVSRTHARTTSATTNHLRSCEGHIAIDPVASGIAHRGLARALGVRGSGVFGERTPMSVRLLSVVIATGCAIAAVTACSSPSAPDEADIQRAT